MLPLEMPPDCVPRCLCFFCFVMQISGIESQPLGTCKDTPPQFTSEWQWKITIFSRRCIFKELFFHCHASFCWRSWRKEAQHIIYILFSLGGMDPWANTLNNLMQIVYWLALSFHVWVVLLYHYPIGSMYGIFSYIWLISMVNVGKYTIHGSYGYWYVFSFLVVCIRSSANCWMLLDSMLSDHVLFARKCLPSTLYQCLTAYRTTMKNWLQWGHVTPNW